MRDVAGERERRRQARIKALAQGFALKDFNFNDERVLLNFGIKATRVFSPRSEDEFPDENKKKNGISEDKESFVLP